MVLTDFLARALTAAGALTTLAVSAGVQPSDPGVLAASVGKAAPAITFVSLDGNSRPVPAPGKPAVVIAFASWCAACLSELPRTIEDYERYKDRADFVGIDYTESPQTAAALVERYHIPFPVESYVPATAAGTAPGKSSETFTISNTMTRAQILNLADALPHDLFEKVLAVYDARLTMSPADFAAFERANGVSFEDPKAIAADMALAKKNAPATLDLPQAFVIDGKGVVAEAIEGYTPSVDRIALALVKLGL